MSYFRTHKTNLVLAVIAAVSLLGIALWQLNLFLLYRNASGQPDMTAGMNHLWWAVGSGVIAMIVIFSVFSILVHYDDDNERHVLSRIQHWKIKR